MGNYVSVTVSVSGAVSVTLTVWKYPVDLPFAVIFASAVPYLTIHPPILQRQVINPIVHLQLG